MPNIADYRMVEESVALNMDYFAAEINQRIRQDGGPQSGVSTSARMTTLRSIRAFRIACPLAYVELLPDGLGAMPVYLNARLKEPY